MIPPDGVALTQAVAAAARADPRISDPDGLEAYLRALPHAFRLFAAVDRAGVVRATSASGVFGTDRDGDLHQYRPGVGAGAESHSR